MRYHLIHLGCQMNHSDGERIRSVLHAMGYSPTDKEEDADLLGIVACSVRQKAIDKVYSKIAKWNDWKNERNILTFVSGCILPSDREKFLERFDLLFSINELPDLPAMISQYGVSTPAALDHGRMERAAEVARHNADKIARPPGTAAMTPVAGVAGGKSPQSTSSRPVGPLWLKDPKPNGLAFTPSARPAGITRPEKAEAARKSTLHSIRALQDELRSLGGAQAIGKKILPAGGAEDPMGGFWHIAPSYTSSFEAFVPIQNGCDKFCTFCAVPYTRGREVSRPSEEILSEVQDLVDRGYKSITLLGQNVNSYGLDKPDQEISFPELMRRIGEMGDQASAQGRRFWVYFTSPHPRDMTEELLHVVARYDCLAKQIHLPIQSGDEKVLFKMNRNHSMARYREVAENVRRILPTATLFTDIIVGFSGETEAQFQNTKKAMEEFQYNMAFIAMYSPRPGAASSRWDDDVSQTEKKRRLAVLSEVLHRSSGAHNQAMVGTAVSVLVESFDAGSGWLSGKTEGKLNIRLKAPVSVEHPESLVGEFVRVRVSSCKAMSLEGDFQLVESMNQEAVRA